jgi:putative peptidoglycan lipid II flippase
MRRWGALVVVAAPDGELPAAEKRTHSVPDEVRGTAGDSLLVAAGTALSRITGVVRVLAVGAVLGPTWFGNAYQVTNSLPNLIYYGFLAGSLMSSLLVPLLIRQIDTGQPERAAAICGGFLGVIFAGATLLLPLAAWGLPLLLQAAGADGSDGPDRQVELARVLVIMTVPQIYLYAVAGTGAAVLYAHRRYLLAALAPALENVGVIAVLAVVALQYGAAGSDAGDVPLSELLLLGLGSTAAVGLHAGLQWWGARRCGVRLQPQRGWHDADVNQALRRAGHAVMQAGLLALQMLALLLVASLVSGGAVALQISLNFYFLPIALVATPVGLALLPRLSRLDQGGATVDFLETLLRGVMLALFVVIPASAGYVAVAQPIAHLVGVGQMATPIGWTMIATSLTMLSLGLAGQTLFFIATQASYARADTVTPLRSMGIQTLLCCALCTAAVATADGPELLPLVAGSYAIASLAAGIYLLLRVVNVCASFQWRLVQSVTRVLAGTGLMLVPVYAVTSLSRVALPGRAGWALAVVGGSLVGLITYIAAQALAHAPELSWLRHDIAVRAVDATGDRP